MYMKCYIKYDKLWYHGNICDSSIYIKKCNYFKHQMEWDKGKEATTMTTNRQRLCTVVDLLALDDDFDSII